MLNIGKAASEDVYSSIIYNGEREMEGGEAGGKKQFHHPRNYIRGTILS